MAIFPSLWMLKSDRARVGDLYLILYKFHYHISYIPYVNFLFLFIERSLLDHAPPNISYQLLAIAGMTSLYYLS